MSIASEITRLYGVRSDIFTAITNKGVQVPAGSQLDDAPTLIGNISGGGGGGSAYTIDYNSPTHSTISGPNCSRRNATINLSISLDNNWVLNNYIVNGNNIVGSSFTMPATDTIVSASISEVSPVILKLEWSGGSYQTIKIGRLTKNNGQTATLQYGYYVMGGGSPTNLSSNDLNNILNQSQWSSGYEIGMSGSAGYLILAFGGTDTRHAEWYTPYASGGTVTATLYQGETIFNSTTYTQDQSSQFQV